jgi:hypothetical protein
MTALLASAALNMVELMRKLAGQQPIVVDLAAM